MHFVDQTSGLVWTALVALLATVFALAVLGIGNSEHEGGWIRLQRLPAFLRPLIPISLRARALWGGILLFLLLLPLATTFPPGMRRSRPPPATTSAELTRAAIAQAQALTRLTETQQALVEEMRRRSACSTCSDRPARPDAGRTLAGRPLSAWGLGGFVLLFLGLWLAFDGGYGWPTGRPPADGGRKDSEPDPEGPAAKAGRVDAG